MVETFTLLIEEVFIMLAIYYAQSNLALVALSNLIFEDVKVNTTFSIPSVTSPQNKGYVINIIMSTMKKKEEFMGS